MGRSRRDIALAALRVVIDVVPGDTKDFTPFRVEAERADVGDPGERE